MSSEVKHYWPEEIVGTGELVVYLQDYAALKADRDALAAELDRLLEGRVLDAETISTLEQELKQSRDAYQNIIDQTTPLEPVPGDPRWSKRIELDEVIAERDQLRAELAAIKEQKPVAYLAGFYRDVIERRSDCHPLGAEISFVDMRWFGQIELFAKPVVGQDVEALAEALKAADEYLSDNPFNEIGSGSILHRQIKDALAAHDKQSGVECDTAAR